MSSAGRPVRVGGPRQQRFLALLLVAANRVVPLERLVDELWESPPQSARQQIHNSVGGLRRVLSEHSADVHVTWTEVGYRLDTPEELIDANRFLAHVREAERLQQQEAVAALRTALDIWRGDVLAGLTGQMIESAAARLQEQRLTVVEDLMSLRLRLGETGSLVGELRQFVAEHPLRESLRISLMQALHRSGRQAEALAVYDEARRLLADELGLDPSARLRLAHTEVLSGSAEPARKPVEVRSYLPHDTSDFSGRSAELGELGAVVASASPTAITISAVDGMGGVGKTALAVHLGHQVAEHYPDGHYFIDLRGFTAGTSPVPPEQALEMLLGDSGVPPELVPATPESRSALWRSQMAGRRILLIIDNAVDAAHVRPLLPGTAGALVVVTSRRKLTALEGALPMSLDVLPAQDAITLFVKIVGEKRTAAEPDAVATAVELCGRLPLAVRIAAARLRDRVGWTVADLVDRLRDHTQRVRFLQADDRNVMAALRVSYRYLSPRQQRLFRLLSLHPGADFDAYAAAVLTGLSLDETEHDLDALFDANLLRQNAAGRFHFHDLIRDCSRQLLESPDEERAGLERLLDYYLHSVHTWCRHHHNTVYRDAPVVDHVPAEVRPVSSAQEAVQILNTEHGNLVEIALFAVDNDWHRHAWQLVCAMQPLLKLHNYGGRAYDLFEGGARAAHASGDVRGESACLLGLAAVCRDHRTRTEARQHVERALGLSRQAGDVEGEIAQLVELANLHMHDDRLEEARDAYVVAEPRLADSSNTFLRFIVANNLGVIYGDLGEFDLALKYLRESETLVSPDDTRSVQFLPWTIGTVLHRRGAHLEALQEFTHGLTSSRAAGNAHGEAFALLGLCGVNRSLGNLAESLEQGRQLLTSARQREMKFVECEAMNLVGETVLAMGDLDHGERTFQEAKTLAELSGYPRDVARAAEGFAHIAFARGELADAQRHWTEAIETYPAGLVDISYARHHVEHLDDPDAVCFRCDVAR